jgi:uncharacterized protein YjgD (DUF1641 family)
MEASLQELNLKIDLLSSQVAYLSEHAQFAERQRLERAELVRDITPLANQAFSLAVEQLEEIQEYIDLNDLLRLFKRLLRNGRNIEKMLDQLESLADLIETVSPLADDAFGKAVDLMAGLEAKGYFSFARGGLNLMDKMVASFSEEELNCLADNIGLIMGMVKEITQPEVIDFANKTLVSVKQGPGKPMDASYIGLVRQMRDPATRRGIALTLRVMQVIGSQTVAEAKPGQKYQQQAATGQLE